MRSRLLHSHSSAARRLRAVAVIAWVTSIFLTLAPAAFASYGRGLWGEVDDKVVTNFGFILIGGFPLIISIFSLIQWRLDKRKEARKAAEKALIGDAHWHGGW
jgi:hypothetical protein